MASANFVNGNDVATFVLETEAPYHILDFDQGLCSMTGYSPRELSDKINTLNSLLYVEDFAEVIASVNYQLSISNLISVQHRIVTKSGTVLTVLCNGQAFSLNDGRDVLQCVFTDITNLENAANESAKVKTDLEIFANTVPSGVSKHLLDNNLSLLWANNYFYDMCGYTPDSYKETFGRHTLSLVVSEDLALVIDALADLTEDSNSTIVNFRIKCADRSIKWVNATFARSGEMSDGFPVVNLVMSDITNLKIAEMKAMLEEQKYRIISDISEELPFEYDLKDDVITFAEKFHHIFDCDAIVANPANAMVKQGLISEDTKSAFEELFQQIHSGTPFYSTEFKLNTRNGGFQWYFSTFSTIYDEDETPLRAVGLLRNIHHQKVEQEKLLQKAETDLMTGLLNKVTTENKIQASLCELNGNSYNILMLVDIDDFKNINDTYGHLKGDEVICRIADVLKEYTGEYDFAGRLGGDEFCVYFTNLLDPQVACEKAKLIADQLRKKYPGDRSCKVTLSIGIASTNEQIPYDTLLENADTALYQAKRNGKNRYYLYQEDMERAEYKNTRAKAAETKESQIVPQLLSVLFSGANTYSSIEKSLKTIASFYDIDKICIWEYEYNKRYVTCTHQWCKNSSHYDKSVRQHTPASLFEELDSMGTNGITYFPDTSLIRLNSTNITPQSEGIKKLVQSRIVLNGKTIGYISLYSMDAANVWSAATFSSFTLILRLLAEAVCSKTSQNNLSLLREDTIRTFNAIQSPILVVDRDTYEIMFYNDTTTDYYPNVVLNSKCYSSLCQENAPCHDCMLHKLSDNRIVTFSKYNKTTDELFDIHMTPVKWSTGRNSFLIAATMHKQTKSERLKLQLEQNIAIEKKIEEASYRDLITEYGNFEKFKLDAQAILNTSPDTDYVLLYLNMKNFKYINENYGHNVGNNTLKTVADVLNRHVHEKEAFARIISDTYIMMLHYEGIDNFMETFRQIKNEINEACKVIQERFTVDFTAGILVIDKSMRSYSINRLVDRAIMAAKSVHSNTGVSYAFFDDDYHKALLNEAQIENSMYSALENNEFCAYVQPKYDINDNVLIGGEVLARWLSPSRGFLEPSAFIPFFEKNGFIYQIDSFILEEACKSLRRYLDADIKVLPFSVNLSRVTLAHPDFLKNIPEIVDRYYIPHHYIEFEITESVLSEDYDEMIHILLQLRNMDFLINMDDFGTGYSSLTLLKDLPVDVIKLDHDFLTRSTTNDKNATYILKSIIDMAHALDIRVVSEGVENTAQLEMLKSINCEVGQGFLFAKPMPIEDYDKLVFNNSLN